MPGMKPGKVVSWKRLLQSEASNLFRWFFGSTLLKHGKHAGNSNESANYIQIFHLA